MTKNPFFKSLSNIFKAPSSYLENPLVSAPQITEDAVEEIAERAASDPEIVGKTYNLTQVEESLRMSRGKIKYIAEQLGISFDRDSSNGPLAYVVTEEQLRLIEENKYNFVFSKKAKAARTKSKSDNRNLLPMSAAATKINMSCRKFQMLTEMLRIEGTRIGNHKYYSKEEVAAVDGAREYTRPEIADILEGRKKLGEQAKFINKLVSKDVEKEPTGVVTKVENKPVEDVSIPLNKNSVAVIESNWPKNAFSTSEFAKRHDIKQPYLSIIHRELGAGTKVLMSSTGRHQTAWFLEDDKVLEKYKKLRESHSISVTLEIMKGNLSVDDKKAINTPITLPNQQNDRKVLNSILERIDNLMKLENENSKKIENLINTTPNKDATKQALEAINDILGVLNSKTLKLEESYQILRQDKEAMEKDIQSLSNRIIGIHSAVSTLNRSSTYEKVVGQIGEGKKQTEIADELGITKQAVNKHYKKAKNKLTPRLSAYPQHTVNTVKDVIEKYVAKCVKSGVIGVNCITYIKIKNYFYLMPKRENPGQEINLDLIKQAIVELVREARLIVIYKEQTPKPKTICSRTWKPNNWTALYLSVPSQKVETPKWDKIVTEQRSLPISKSTGKTIEQLNTEFLSEPLERESPEVAWTAYQQGIREMSIHDKDLKQLKNVATEVVLLLGNYYQKTSSGSRVSKETKSINHWLGLPRHWFIKLAAIGYLMENKEVSMTEKRTKNGVGFNEFNFWRTEDLQEHRSKVLTKA